MNASFPTPCYRAGSLSYSRAGLMLLFGWLLWGDVCYTIMEAVVPTILPIKLKQLGASNVILSVIMTMLPGILSSVLCPWISFWSDRYRSRLGRRIPFILFTAPLLALSLICLGYCDEIGNAVHSWGFFHLPIDAVRIAVIMVFMVSFTFFNDFVGSVFWYLFNDVVPEMFLARFMSMFRVVGILAATFYHVYIFRYAETHMTAIFTGAALLYLFGFGLMCWKVREGVYAPPPPTGEPGMGIFRGVKIFIRECYSIPHYWFLFAMNMFTAISLATSIFTIFWHQSLGLQMDEIGKINGVMCAVGAVMILLSGWIADRYHPIRAVLAGRILSLAVVTPFGLIWLFVTPCPSVVFWIFIAATIVFSPVKALIGIGDPPLLMKVFPRERYGQFCSANALLTCLGRICGGVAAGAFFDLIRRLGATGDFVYRFIPVWTWFFEALTLVCLICFYRSWKKHGGDESYQAPMVSTDLIHGKPVL
ncbi:MAG: MFS transporter [Verrucomicrobiae bacterium]|nr:MFS transporter [Verrucomicrobiae bacterium]